MTPLRFILMLTRNDRTVPEALELVEDALSVGVTHIGFKDVGLPAPELVQLGRAIREAGATSYMEVVSVDRDRELESVKAAVDIGVDHLLGGTRAREAAAILEGSTIGYYPFAGRVEGHPSLLLGDVEEVTRRASDLVSMEGVSGIDLLAYRFAGDSVALLRSVCRAVDKPVLVAGSIRHRAQIASVAEAGARGFTVGTAALDGVFPAKGSTFREQLRAIENAATAGATAGNGGV